MKMHAEPISLDGPLAGGVEGASVIVEPFMAGEVQQPGPWFEHEPGRLSTLKAWGITVPRKEWWWVPCPVYLVRHPGAGTILIDTGLHPSVATNPRENLGRILTRMYGFRQEAGQDAPARLRARGLDPKLVSVVIMTHLHFDHAGAISEFPESTFVVSAVEWAAATTDPRPTLRGYRPSQFDFLFDYVTVDFDAELVGSYGPFGRTFDLFGDGSVRLAFTPGHTLGHMSVILRLPRRDFIAAGDAIFTFRQLEGGAEPARPLDPHSWRRSVQELRLFHREYPYAVIVPGHDPEFFPQLDERYEE